MTSKRQQQEEAGRWLRKARERRGLQTAGALARRMGVSDSLISRIETGATAVTDERAEQIAEALDMDLIAVRRNLGLWVPSALEVSDGEADERVEDPFERLERLLREWREDPDEHEAETLNVLLESWRDRKTG
ncbi:hypothetical protein GCM10010182_67100 [Actinomadura cremea]|nr:hypothetical protein GCM10010182_67100 [Actinomadura cremea]